MELCTTTKIVLSRPSWKRQGSITGQRLQEWWSSSAAPNTCGMWWHGCKQPGAVALDTYIRPPSLRSGQAWARDREGLG